MAKTESITASDVGSALNAIASKVLAQGIIEQEGYSRLSLNARELKSKKSSTSWELSVDRGNPIRFKPIKSKDGILIRAGIICDIKVSQAEGAMQPFALLNMAIEIDDEKNEPLSRWHLDLANSDGDKFQEGPLIHLQYGGHRPEHREKDHPLAIPRWCHPPMELGLVCEVIAANFFPSEWAQLREDPSWCEAIRTCQKLCYSAYLEKLNNCMNVSNSTALTAMWAGRWQ